MKEYSPKRRTAVVFTGTGVSGAYHAGVLRALDESGTKIDVVVGSGAGCVAAAFAAVAGGARLLRPRGLLGRGRLGVLLPPATRAAGGRAAAGHVVRRLPAAAGPRPAGRAALPGRPAARPGGAFRRASPCSRGCTRCPPSCARPTSPRCPCPCSRCRSPRWWRWPSRSCGRRRRFAEAFESPLDAAPGRRRLVAPAVGGRARLRHLRRCAVARRAGPPLRRAARGEPGPARLPRAGPARGGPGAGRRAARSPSSRSRTARRSRRLARATRARAATAPRERSTWRPPATTRCSSTP